MDLDGPRRGARDNGLRCSGYVAVADFDPRIADAMLEALRDNGIAAYAAPTPGRVGGAMETRLPDRPIDRLWVDAGRLERAHAVIEHEGIDSDDLDTGGLDSGTLGSGPAAGSAAASSP